MKKINGNSVVLRNQRIELVIAGIVLRSVEPTFTETFAVVAKRPRGV